MSVEIRRAVLLPGLPEPVAYGLWHMEQSREWTLAYVDGLSQEALDHLPAGHRHSVATLLYHIAVFEVDWIYIDVLGNEYDMDRRIPECPTAVKAHLTHPLLLEDGSYTPVSGESLQTHLDRLAAIRTGLIDVVREMSLAEFRAPRPSGDGEVTPEWVLMHLARHESEHRGQIWEARLAAEATLPTHRQRLT